MKRSIFLKMALFLVAAFFSVNQSKAQVGIHDPSKIIYCEGRYYIFGTGDGIHMVSSNSVNFDSYQEETSPFAYGYPSWIRNYVGDFEGYFWAPDIVYMNNQYYLYYSCSSWGTMNSCTGVATNKTLNPNSPDYRWVDQGDIGIHSPSYFEGGNYNVNAIDPAVMIGPNGRAWMLYGSFNKSGIVATEISTTTGKPIGNRVSVANSYTGTNSGYHEGEGAFMFYNNGYYYLIYNKGGCCDLLNSTYYMVIGRSTSPMGPFYDKSGNPMKVNGAPSGGTRFLSTNGRYVGPGHFSYGEGKMTYHYYDGNSYGYPRLKVANLYWGSDGWPYAEVEKSEGSIIPSGSYKITNKNSNRVLDAANCGSADGTNVQQWDDLNNVCQSWNIKYAAEDFFYIENSNSGKVIGVQNCGFDSGTNIDLWTNNGSWCQMWSFVDQGDGSYRIVNRSNGKDMEVDAASTSAGANIHSWISNNLDRQKWYIEKVGDDNLVDGTYILTNRNSGKVLDVTGCNSADGANVQQWTNLNNACQQWVVQRKSNGLYTLKNVNSGKMLDVVGCGTGDGTNVDQWTDYNNACQEWDIVETGDGYFYLVNSNSGKNLEVANASTSNGANVQIYSANSNWCQQWSLIQSKSTGDGLMKNLTPVSIYPNPVNDVLNFKNLTEGSLYAIYSIQGQQIQSGMLNENTLSVDNLMPGMYIIGIDNLNGDVVKLKFIKE